MSCSTSDSGGESDAPDGAITSNDINTHNGYTYEFWMDNGTGSGWMLLGDGATFQVEWNGISNLLARLGVRPGDENLSVQYNVEYQPSGNSYMCVYGWTQNNLIEYYIVDNWGTWRPPGEGYKATVTIDGAEYDLYETTRTNMPSIEGTATFQQYWSVRQTPRSSGTIDVSAHFDAWNANGMILGSSLYEVSFCIEGYQSSGTADIIELNFQTQ